MKVLNLTRFIPIFASAFLCVGCGDPHLTRDEAAELIGRRFPMPVTGEIAVGDNFKVVNNIWDGKMVFPPSGGLGHGNKLDALTGMESKGAVTLDFANAQEKSGPVSVSLTDEGKKFMLSIKDAPGILGGTYPFKIATVKLCEKKFAGVTGIVEDSQSKHARVDFEWEYGEFSPFYEYLREDAEDRNVRYASEAQFTLYDDGWRLD